MLQYIPPICYTLAGVCVYCAAMLKLGEFLHQDESALELMLLEQDKEAA